MLQDTITTNQATVTSQTVLDPKLAEILTSLRNFAMKGKAGTDQINILMAMVQSQYPDSVELAKHSVTIGRKICSYINTAQEYGKKGKSKKDFKTLYDKFTKNINENTNDLYVLMLTAYKTAKNETQINKLKKENNGNVPPMLECGMLIGSSTLEDFGVHPNFLTRLLPSTKWTVLIDETGSEFYKHIRHPEKNTRGRIAAIIIPDYCKLPKLKLKYHGNKENKSLVEKVVDKIIHSDCGVLGIAVDSLHALDGDMWYVGVETLIDLIIRLLPINGKTEIKVFIEQRSQYTPEMSKYLPTAFNSCLNYLARSNPHRAESISLDGQFIQKTDQRWNGYADTVAYCWGGSSAAEILKKSGWKDSCLLGSDSEQLCSIIDFLQKQKPLSAREWEELINRSEASVPHSLINILLKIQGDEASVNVELWNEYLEQVQKHLYSKAINISVLGQQVEWLKTYAPINAVLSPQTRLVWLTTQLAQANHLGKTNMVKLYWKEFEELCNLIYPENAPLTCLALLHIVVAYMNDYNFKRAYDILEIWNSIDEAIPGRKNYGAIRSTLGQLNAFMGNQETAINFFNEAIFRLMKLINPDEAKKETNQTLAYKVIAMMDSTPTPASLPSEMERYLGYSFRCAAEHFAISDEPGESHMHHIFLRYLVHVDNPDRQKIIDEYMSHSSQWKNGVDHPWELILFYRALLQSDIEIKKLYLNKAYQRTPQVDGVLSVIACVILGSLYFYDASCKEELEKLTEQVIQTMPHLGEERVDALRNQLDSPIEPLELAKKILPFNFR